MNMSTAFSAINAIYDCLDTFSGKKSNSVMVTETDRKRITDLLDNVIVATENLDDELINELEPIVNELKQRYSNHGVINDMIKMIIEAKSQIDLYNAYIEEKAKLMPELTRYYKGDKHTAEIEANEMAKGLIYGN